MMKLPRLNALTCHELDTYDLAFKLRRKKFTIEVGVILVHLFSVDYHLLKLFGNFKSVLCMDIKKIE